MLVAKMPWIPLATSSARATSGQTGKALQNVETALAAGGAELQQVVKWNIYVVHGQSAQAGVEAFQKVWGQRPNPPVVTVLFVAALAHPDFLVEIDAVAVVPQK
jgi:enamine deaminase RidA (YjgF/YER057c/UK114 family)